MAPTAPYVMACTCATEREKARDEESVGTRLAVYWGLHLLAPYCAAKVRPSQPHSTSHSPCHLAGMTSRGAVQVQSAAANGRQQVSEGRDEESHCTGATLRWCEASCGKARDVGEGLTYWPPSKLGLRTPWSDGPPRAARRSEIFCGTQLRLNYGNPHGCQTAW